MKTRLLLLALVFVIVSVPVLAQNSTEPLDSLTPYENDTPITNPALPFDADSGAPVSPNVPVAPVQEPNSNLPEVRNNLSEQSSSTFAMPNTNLQITIPGASQPSNGTSGGSSTPNFSGGSSGIGF